MKVVGPCHRYEGRICAEEEEDISIVERRKRRGARVYRRAVKKEVY